MAKILAVDDDVQNLENISEWLAYDQHLVEVAYDGDEGWARLGASQYDLVILDWDMPGLKGIDIVVKMRSKGDKTPILMLTGKGAIRDKESGLDSGADDYLTKPFHMKELSARVRALLRRTAGASTNELRVGSLVLDPRAHRVTKNGVEVHLLPTEFTLLEFLMRHPGEVFSADALLNRVRDSNSEATAEAIRTCLRRLRVKIADDDSKSPIATIHGVGYKLET